MTAMNIMKDRAKALEDMAAKVQPAPIGGLVEGVAMLTPRAVQRLKLANGVIGAG